MTQQEPHVFPLGVTLITPKAQAICRFEMRAALLRHMQCDWGECSPVEAQANDNAATNGGLVWSVHRDSASREFWIVTEVARGETTVLLPEDY